MIDTQGHASVLAEPPGTGLSRRSAGWIVAVFVGIVIAALMGLVHVPYAVLSPGPITNTLGNAPGGKPLITVEGKATYPTKGTLDFTTVAVLGGPSNPVNGWDLVRGYLDNARSVVPAAQLFPEGVTPQEVDQENAAEMADSQQEAIAVALRGLGERVPEVVKVRDLSKDSPARGVLRAGDVLVSIDGAAVTTPDAVRKAVRARKAGENATFTVLRAGKQQVVSVKTAESGGHTVVGVFLQAAFDFPIKVSINAGDVGGPSAGMMFSLAIYDKLTPGALTGGAQIAGTGTIDGAGTVGPIGGIQQKLVGAKRGGATWFLAPAKNCEEVVGHVPEGLQVVKVATFSQAREAVTAIAAKRTSSLPRCT
ncbi:MAG: PDZ domain-containing protein [Dermatophilaceae bacterium]